RLRRTAADRTVADGRRRQGAGPDRRRDHEVVRDLETILGVVPRDRLAGRRAVVEEVERLRGLRAERAQGQGVAGNDGVPADTHVVREVEQVVAVVPLEVFTPRGAVLVEGDELVLVRSVRAHGDLVSADDGAALGAQDTVHVEAVRGVETVVRVVPLDRRT